MADLSNLKNVSEQDRQMLQEAEVMMGPEPSEMGFVKNMFWGNFRQELVFPYPEVTAEEKRKADKLLATLDEYLCNEHPSIQIDQDQEIPGWVIKRLFDLGVLGMTIPEQYGGLGLGITSYNRVLERIGRSCASTSVMVSAHQSIGCKAVMLFGTEEQKKRWLPQMAKSSLSAFCLSEPNVGCDAGGQETRCELSADGQYYIINGEKKWSTSGAYSELFTVMAKQKFTDKKGKVSDRVTALVCTPEMEGIDIFQKNRSKCGIRGTWQARIRFTNVRVPKENLLHQEGKGLNVALTCLNYGRCTLSAGILGAARGAMEQSIKWARTRYQFQRPLADFEQMQQYIARMSALCYAIDAVLYMTTGMLDRHDNDIMVETAVSKVFASEMGWRVVDDAMQIMGGEGYMTENELERTFRDARIYRIVEGANEVMHSFIFGYGGKQLAEQMVGLQEALLWDGDQSFFGNIGRIVKNGFNFKIVKVAVTLGAQLYLGAKKQMPAINNVHPSLLPTARRIAWLVQDHSRQFKLASKRHKEAILKYQCVQARLSENAIMLHAMTCVLAKLDMQVRYGQSGPAFEADRTAAEHFLDLAELKIKENVRAMTENADESMRKASDAAIKLNDSLPNSGYYVPEKSPVAAGTGRTPQEEYIKQFPGDRPRNIVSKPVEPRREKEKVKFEEPAMAEAALV